MKRIAILIALLLPLSAFAQSNETGARASVGVDYKIQKGLHLSLDEELRLGDGLGNLDRLQTTLELSYKPLKYLKVGVGYSLINPYKKSDSSFGDARHRIFVSAAGYLSLGDFHFSLKETLQLTKRSGTFNEFQTNPNALALKSRVGLKYKGWSMFTPGLAFEVRTQLNEPWGYKYGSLHRTEDGRTFYYYQHTGYSHKYIDRYRIQAGCDIKLSPNHTLSPYVLYDICSEYELDTSGKGKKLFSAAYEDVNRFSIGLSYVFSF